MVGAAFPSSHRGQAKKEKSGRAIGVADRWGERRGVMGCKYDKKLMAEYRQKRRLSGI